MASGLSVTTDAFSYSVETRDKCCKRLPPIEILKAVEVCVQPGTFLAILGPSGSGKTTFLNAIAARLQNKGGVEEGKIYYGGVAGCSQKNIRTITNYVMQHDRMIPFLTAEETLKFSANLRMRGATKDEKQARIEDVIRQLSITKCRGTVVGGENKKGLSGGETKRVAVASELLDDPTALFLDEPTSGLDATNAAQTLKFLIKLGKQRAKTIVCTLHQPRSSLFHCFDQLMLLNRGEVVYYGKASMAVEYFSKIGYTCLPSFNPADFILDLVVGECMYAEGVEGSTDVGGETPLQKKRSSDMSTFAVPVDPSPAAGSEENEDNGKDESSAPENPGEVGDSEKVDGEADVERGSGENDAPTPIRDKSAAKVGSQALQQMTKIPEEEIQRLPELYRQSTMYAELQERIRLEKEAGSEEAFNSFVKNHMEIRKGGCCNYQYGIHQIFVRTCTNAARNPFATVMNIGVQVRP
eukprot:GHVU01138643.1.p1 GENE.GHVU01138643.1~~GHVU01138643.1.p1  ORF type:complete len:468 (+),score=63.41 GHVU01138643.1:232-1635(+)